MKGTKKKKHVINPLIIVSSILCLSAVAGLFIFFYVTSGKMTPHPAFEEDYVSSNKFKTIITKVDHLVYESLYREGVAEEDISFSKVIPRHESNLD